MHLLQTNLPLLQSKHEDPITHHKILYILVTETLKQWKGNTQDREKGREDIITFKNMTMTEIVDIEIGSTPKIITKETNHGMTMKETDPLAQRDHMIETIHTVETDHGIAMIQIDPINRNYSYSRDRIVRLLQK